ncbi:MAG: 50S ribosomal protein L9 [Candidatus Aminicenantes bacterium]|nr:MAG: 50S ribosomal protein L9 [Candidatus Aminicenantes bacterium]RLE05138.1 MAG: 50S ribosomal protein L9 [Candidatus Aminicenantes bacterium]
MKIMLRENIENLGKRGDIVEVAPGYARNYLLPRKLALEVTPTNMKMIEMQQRALRKKLEKELSSYQEMAQKLSQVKLTFYRKTSDKEALFGSVSLADIKEALEKEGFALDKKKILLPEPIKSLGSYKVPIKVFHEERAEIEVQVLPEEAAETPAEEPKVAADQAEASEIQPAETESTKTTSSEKEGVDSQPE